MLTLICFCHYWIRGRYGWFIGFRGHRNSAQVVPFGWVTDLVLLDIKIYLLMFRNSRFSYPVPWVRLAVWIAKKCQKLRYGIQASIIVLGYLGALWICFTMSQIGLHHWSRFYLQECCLYPRKCVSWKPIVVFFFLGGGKEIDRSKSANRAVMFHLSDTKQSWNMNLSCGA